METFVVYLLKTGVWIGIFWLVYGLFLRKETFYRFNRYYLLAGLILPFVIPLLQLKYQVELAASASFSMPGATVETQPVDAPFNWTLALLVVYSCGIVAIATRYLAGLRKLAGLLMSQPTRKTGQFHLVDSPDFRHPFSVFNFIFMDTQSVSDTTQKMILEHEQAHIRQKHWVDLSLCNLVCALQWFNPFAWLYVNAVKQNHEYLADQSVMKSGHSPAIYQAVLLSYTLNIRASALVHSFAHSSGKASRFQMMKKKVSNPLRKSFVLLIFPVLAVFLWAFAQPVYTFGTQNTIQEPTIAATDTVPVSAEATVSHTPKKSEKQKRQKANQPAKPAPTNAEPAAPAENKEIQAIDFEKLKLTTPKLDYQSYVDTSAKFQLKQVEQPLVVRISDATLEANPPIILLDGVEVPYSTLKTMNTDNVQSIEVYKNKTATDTYGEKGKNGVISIRTKKDTNQ